MARRARDRGGRDRGDRAARAVRARGSSATPTPTSPPTCRRLLGRLTYPIGYWNGLAAVMSAAIVLLLLVRGEGRTARVRARAVAALPPVLLALWMTDSRGGMVAAGLAFVVLLLVGRRRVGLLANLALGLVAGAA